MITIIPQNRSASPDGCLDLVRTIFDQTLKNSWSDEGVRSFYELIEKARVFNPFRYYLAVDGMTGDAAGVLACDEAISHIVLLFVSPDYSRKGVGSALISAVANATGESGLTVNAELTAENFYVKNGFRRINDSINEKDGIKTVKMFKKIKKPDRINVPPAL